MISQTAEYALRAVVFLAMNSGAAFTTQQISTATKAPAAYLSKVLQLLARAGLVQSQRGLRGGFILARCAEGITILEVINSVDPIQRIRICPLGLESHGMDLCALHRRLDDANAAIETAFRETTIGALLTHPTKSTPLCESAAK
jgi:Rrf2 family transcriptional regulator, nitric oxide-sensitive transcriptional repressor